MIYDRDLQSVVDKLFPQFIAAEKLEEVKFYESKGIPLKTSSNKHERDRADDVQQAAKRSKQAPVSTDENTHRSADQEEEFTVRIDACDDCDSALKMPVLAKRMCKAQYSIKVNKLKRFVHKRLPEDMQESMTAEDIEMIYKGAALEDDKKLSHFRSDIKAAMETKTSIAFTYRRKRPVSV